MDLIQKCLGVRFQKIFKVTYFMDIFSYALIPTLATQKLFQYNLFNFGFIDQNWFKDIKTLSVDEESPQQVFWRRIYFSVLFLTLVPFFLQREMKIAHRLSLIYLSIFVVVIAFLLVELRQHWIKLPLLDSQYQTGQLLQKIGWDFPEKGMVFFIGYYVQPYIFQLRGHMKRATQKKLNIISRISISVEVLLFLVISILCYYVYGDRHTPELFILRKQLNEIPSLSDNIYKYLMAVFFIASSIGLCAYSESLRGYLE